ncbi:MAG: aminotransferase class I/II-fold pyridoxal phosphate-dependent enzyme [Terriglobia bacterium]
MSYFLSSKLPPYVFEQINRLKAAARSRGVDIIDLGMGNPDLATPEPIVEKLIEAVRNPRNHRYSVSRGIAGLRLALAERYERMWGVKLDPEREVVATIGAKEGLSHLVLTLLAPNDAAIVPEPCYPIHAFSVVIAGGRLERLPWTTTDQLLQKLQAAVTAHSPRLVILSFPHNPTGVCVDKGFFEEVVRLALEYGFSVIHDFAYADLAFENPRPPSILQVERSREVAVEIYSLSKSYNMAGWRVGFCVGNPEMVGALARVKSYMDYGIFQPIQIAATVALRNCEPQVELIREEYRRRRDVLVKSLNEAGWKVEKPAGSMFLWAAIPDPFKSLGSLEFAKVLLERAQVAVSPGIGFGESGDGYVRFALVENEERIRQAARGIKSFLKAGI